MTAKTVMIMGTHSNAGKSMLVTALCRIYSRRGYRVAPFKAQNMALNAGVTMEGHEIGRATVAQAQAAGVPAHVDMNPVLLKPEGNSRSQVVLDGRPYGHIEAKNWHSLKPKLWTHVTAALTRLRARTDLVIIEGAGSPAEINLKHSDIVNMRVARAVDAPVLLVGDIDRGGVFAALVGTMVLLEPEEREQIKAFVVNKFRGDIGLLGDGLQMLQERAFDTPTVGVLPFLPNIGIAAEDSVSLDEPRLYPTETNPQIDIAVIRIPRISNFDDFDPLAAEEGVQVRYVSQVDELGQPDAIIIPGTKTTLADLYWLQETGLASEIAQYADNQGNVVGICGGYQMLGQHLADPEGAEAEPGATLAGLQLLPLNTTFVREKRTVLVEADLEPHLAPFLQQDAVLETRITGYEIHMGASVVTDPSSQALCHIHDEDGRHADGLVTNNGRIWGTYLHGIFDNDLFRQAWLRHLGWTGVGKPFDRQQAYDRLADHVEKHLDMAMLDQFIWGD
ncbi:MAG: cobyric acid synthase [Chloroflexota bacterium]